MAMILPVASLEFLSSTHNGSTLALITNSEKPKIITTICSSRHMPILDSVSEPIDAHSGNSSIPCMAVKSASGELATAANGEVKLWNLQTGM